MVTAYSDLAKTLEASNDIKGAADKVDGDVKKIDKNKIFSAATGLVFSLYSAATPSAQEDMLDKIEEISKKLDQLDQDVHTYFNILLKAAQQDICRSNLFQY